ncbi:Ribosomal RNA small subunit methyltransferase E [Clostridiaceae bacterium JG1575]|nr:Ribosomal RNA small subunit methyltransferase E [Clostridiaceae bacterium JG1575]
MHKFFTDRFGDGVAFLTKEDVRHAGKVLRLKVGDAVLVNDLKGNDYEGVIERLNKEEGVISGLKRLDDSTESPLFLHVFQGIPKGQKMDLIVQKLCELGVQELTPLWTQRVVPGTLNEAKKIDRWRRISLEAAKQAGRSVVLQVNEPLDLAQVAEKMDEFDLILLFWEEASGVGLRAIQEEIKAGRRVGLVVGPEGGLCEPEVQRLREAGAKVLTLGPRILRTETCALTVVSILQYLGGDLGGVFSSVAQEEFQKKNQTQEK